MLHEHKQANNGVHWHSVTSYGSQVKD